MNEREVIGNLLEAFRLNERFEDLLLNKVQNHQYKIFGFMEIDITINSEEVEVPVLSSATSFISKAIEKILNIERDSETGDECTEILCDYATNNNSCEKIEDYVEKLIQLKGRGKKNE